MPMEIEGIRMRRGWTSTSAISTHKAPFAGLGVLPTSPVKTMQGLKVSVLTESNRSVPVGEFNLLFTPVLKELGLELVGKPKLAVDDQPIWVWRKLYQDPSDPAIKPGEYVYEAVLASGPFKGHVGPVMAPSDCTQKFDAQGREISWKCEVGTPTVKDTAALPRYVSEWSVMLRPVTAEDMSSKKSEVSKALREPRGTLQKALQGSVGTQVKLAQVESPKAKGTAGGATAAIIGIALAALAWTQRGSR